MIDESGVNKTDIELDKVDMTPEELILHAAMGQAEQWLGDHGHPLPANAKDEKVMIKEMNDSRDFTGEERDKYIELRLAPWYRSQNYSAASQTSLASGTGSNALSNVLQLKDEGDPTGRGEGFSLLECSRKQMPESELRLCFAVTASSASPTVEPADSLQAYDTKEQVAQGWRRRRQTKQVEP